MHYHFNYPYYPAAWQEEDQGIIPNGCVTQGTNGTKYGYDTSVPIGANTPDALPSGQSIYANYWLADGTFIMQFGDLGNEPIPDVEFIFTVIDGTLLQYVWQSDTLYYEANNLTLATQLIADYVLDEDVCYTALPILQKMISYDMNITDVEGTNTLINNTSYAPHFNAPVINATQNGPGSILVDGTTDIDTGFKPNIARYSIEETVTGELANFGDNQAIGGDFTTGVAGWNADSGNTVVWEESEQAASIVAANTSRAIYYPTSLSIGTYSISFRVKHDRSIAQAMAFNIYSGSGFSPSHNIGVVQPNTWATVSFEEDIVATNGTYGCYVNITSGTAADVKNWFDDISFKLLEAPTQRTEARLLTHTDAIPETKYYINGIEQAVTPPLPDPTVTINLNDTAVIGYPDTIQSREAYFNVHTEILTPTFETTGDNLYPNWELINGSHINQDIPLGTLPDGHVLAFNTGDPCNATYNDNGDGTFSYLFNQVQDPARLVLQQTIGYGIFEVGKRYRYQAKVRTVTFNPIATQLRAIHIAAAVDLVIIDADNAMIDEEVGYELKWIDFEVTDSGISRANFRHGCGVWDVLTTAQETRELAIYELTTV